MTVFPPRPTNARVFGCPGRRAALTSLPAHVVVVGLVGEKPATTDLEMVKDLLEDPIAAGVAATPVEPSEQESNVGRRVADCWVQSVHLGFSQREDEPSGVDKLTTGPIDLPCDGLQLVQRHEGVVPAPACVDGGVSCS